MTHRAEFQPERPALPEHYMDLIAAAERVIYYRCVCAHPGKQCQECVFGPLRTVLKTIYDEKNRMADGRG